MPASNRLGAPRECLSCHQVKPHNARGLCVACYKHHVMACSIERFPPLRNGVSPRARYDGWVASGLTPREYARSLGIWETSLSRSLRIERERRERLGLTWLTGWRKVRGGGS
jgi:hypothetical protein